SLGVAADDDARPLAARGALAAARVDEASAGVFAFHRERLGCNRLGSCIARTVSTARVRHGNAFGIHGTSIRVWRRRRSIHCLYFLVLDAQARIGLYIRRIVG